MMRPSNKNLSIYLYKNYVDMRKCINGLGAIVEGEMSLNIFDGSLFVFCNKSRKVIKILYWERNGFAVWKKRLEEERFHWLKFKDKDIEQICINVDQLNWLLDGIDITKIKPHKELKYKTLL